MKLVIERSDLLMVLSKVAGIVAKRSTVPILSNVLIEADGGRLTVRATDLDMEATATVGCGIETAGACTAPASTLLDIARNVADGAQVSMAYDGEAQRLEVRAGRAKWKVPTLPAEQFPALKPETWAVSVEVKGAALADVLTRTAWAAATEVNRQNMMGVNLELGAGALTAIAACGPQLALATTDVNGTAEPITVPSRMVTEMIRACDGQDVVTLGMNDRRVVGADWAITSKIIAMPFVAWPSLIDMERAGAFEVDAGDLIAAVKRAVITAEGGAERAVALDVSAGALRVSTRATCGEADDEIEADYDGEAARFGLEAGALLQMLAAVKGERVRVRFNAGQTTPVLIEGAGDASCVVVSGLMRV